MQPTGSQIKQLQQALLAAYDQTSLDRMVRIRLDADLEQLVPTSDKNLTEITHALVRTCAAQPGGFRRLLDGALAGNPGNPALRAAAKAFAGIVFEVLPFPDAEQRAIVCDTIIANVGDNAQQVIIGKNINIGQPAPTPAPNPIRRRVLFVGVSLGVAVLLVAVALLLPADNRFGWVQAQIDQRTCRANQNDGTCILASRLAPGSGKASQEATRLLESSLRDAVEGSPFTVVRTRPVQDRQTALALARRYVSPLIVWGEVFDLNDLNAKVHLELVDRLGIAQSAELEPYRLQQFPVDGASITVDIPCEGEADCLGPESGRLAQSAPDVARLAMGLTSYALGDFEQAKTELEPLAACALALDEPACTDPALLPYLDDQARSLLLYYMGRVYGFQQDYEHALIYLEAARKLAPDNPAPAIAAGWTYLKWIGDGVVPVEAQEAFAQAREKLKIECGPNNTAVDAGERLYTLGVIYEMQAQWANAEACYVLAANALAQRDADPYPVLINLARVQRLDGQQEAAIETLTKAQKLAPDLPWTMLELARLNADNETEARAHLDRALAIAPNILQVHTTTAELCERWGDLDMRRKRLSDCPHAASRPQLAAGQYGRILSRTGRLVTNRVFTR